MADLEEEPSVDFAPQGSTQQDESEEKNASGDNVEDDELAKLQAEIAALDNDGADMDDNDTGAAADDNGALDHSMMDELANIEAEVNGSQGSSDGQTSSSSSRRNGLEASPTLSSSQPQNGSTQSDAIVLDDRETQQIADLAQHVDKQTKGEEGDQADADQRSIYVGNVDYSCTVDQLEAYFKSCGEVSRATILVDKFTGQPKGYAYVEFLNKTSVKSALLLNESEINGRKLKISPKRKNLPHFMRGGYRGGRSRGRSRGGRRPYGGGGGYRARGGYRASYRGRRSRGYYAPY